MYFHILHDMIGEFVAIFDRYTLVAKLWMNQSNNQMNKMFNSPHIKTM